MTKILIDEATVKQEPVAWLDEEKRIVYWHNTHDVDDYHGFKRTTPLYTSPQPAQRKPLTEKEFEVLHHKAKGYVHTGLMDVVRIVEHHHGIKEKT